MVDANINFLHLFKEMCAVLDITFWSLSRGKHKGLSVERYHQFLKKTQTIVGNDRRTYISFIENSKTP